MGANERRRENGGNKMTTGIPTLDYSNKYTVKFKSLTLLSKNGKQLKDLRKQLIHLVGKWTEEQICEIICKAYDIGFRDSL